MAQFVATTKIKVDGKVIEEGEVIKGVDGDLIKEWVAIGSAQERKQYEQVNNTDDMVDLSTLDEGTRREVERLLGIGIDAAEQNATPQQKDVEAALATTAAGDPQTEGGDKPTTEEKKAAQAALDATQQAGVNSPPDK